MPAADDGGCAAGPGPLAAVNLDGSPALVSPLLHAMLVPRVALQTAELRQARFPRDMTAPFITTITVCDSFHALMAGCQAFGLWSNALIHVLQQLVFLVSPAWSRNTTIDTCCKRPLNMNSLKGCRLNAS